VSTTTTGESEWVSETDDSRPWQFAMRRHGSRSQRQPSLNAESVAGGRTLGSEEPRDGETAADGEEAEAEHEDGGRPKSASWTAASPSRNCRLTLMHQTMNAVDHTAELVFTGNAGPDFALITQGGAELVDPHHNRRQQHGSQQERDGSAYQMQVPPPSPPPPFATGGDLPPLNGAFSEFLGGGEPPGDLAAAMLLRAPSPPPLPGGWDLGQPSGLLFDFDQFDASRRATLGGHPEPPLVTVTSTMNPSEMSNPSDDYIWQIMFAGEDDAMPKRVTAHLHHPQRERVASPQDPAGSDEKHLDARELATIFDDDEPDPVLDSIVACMEKGKEKGQMPPPPPRQPSDEVPLAPHSNVPPLPVEALQATIDGAQDPKTVTVTYVLTSDERGKQQYTVQSVSAGVGGTEGLADGGVAAVGDRDGLALPKAHPPSANVAPVAVQKGNGTAVNGV
jgi:hypothetical protein